MLRFRELVIAATVLLIAACTTGQQEDAPASNTISDGAGDQALAEQVSETEETISSDAETSDAETSADTGSDLETSTGCYPIVDTGQFSCYDNMDVIAAPVAGAAFDGQDAQFVGNQPSYFDNGDGTVSDLVTELEWCQSPDTDGDGDIDADDKLSYEQALAYAESLELAGHDDWRVPSIKELYSLILFSGRDPSGVIGNDTSGLTPFIDDSVFAFAYGDTAAGERIIDAQFVTTSVYTSTVFSGQQALFGVNFADGRIKGYPLSGKTFYVLLVRGNERYGENDFSDNGDGTISDAATGLMWEQADSATGMNWQEALAWAAAKNAEQHLGYSDWRLPNAKELQSIVDYSRSPDATASAAIDPLFTCSSIINEGGVSDFPFYWSSSTHANTVTGSYAAYVAFGEASGWMHDVLMDVHGAGAQRSDPKAGDAADYPTGHGPQGDVVRIDNYVRLVRDDMPASAQ